MNAVRQIVEEELADTLLSPLPGTTLEIMRIVNDPCFEFGELVRPISLDPDLTARLLRLANSPLYGRSRTIAKIGDAVVLLGSGMVLSMALACVARPSAKYGLSGFDLTQSTFWNHCVASVSAAEALQRSGVAQFGSGFASAALLHDYGKLLLASVMTSEHHSELRRLRCNDLNRSDVECEREVLGIDHAAAGAAVVAKWNLPESIVKAIGAHHSPVDWSDHLTNGVIMANQLAKDTSCANFDHEESENVAEAMLALGLTDPTYRQILELQDSRADALSRVM